MAARNSQALGVIEEPLDELDPDEEQALRQAEVGTMFKLQGPEYDNVQWTFRRFRTTAELARDSAGGMKYDVLPVNVIGPLNPPDVIALIGGGTFNALGYVPRTGGGVKIRYNETFAIAAPRRNFDIDNASPLAPNGAAISPPAPPAVDPTMAALKRQNRMLRQAMETERRAREADQREARMLEQMRAMVAGIPRGESSKPVGLLDIVALVKELKTIGGSDNPIADPAEMTRLALDMFRQGFTIGEGREPAEEGAAREPAWLGPAAKLIERMMTRPASPPPQPVYAQPAGQPRPAERSQATVVEPPRPATVAGNPNGRWQTAAESVSRGLGLGEDPESKAESIRDMLNETELAQLIGEPDGTGTWRPTAEEVTAWIAGNVGDYPQLRSPGGKTYLESVLHALRRVDADESEEDSVAE